MEIKKRSTPTNYPFLIKKAYKSQLVVAKKYSSIKMCLPYLEVINFIYEKFDVQEIASKLKVSASYLSKLFKEEKKISLGQFTRMRKIETSKILLSNTDKSISEIALSLSFNSQSHFGRVFLEITGYTPAQFRNLNQNL